MTYLQLNTYVRYKTKLNFKPESGFYLAKLLTSNYQERQLNPYVLGIFTGFVYTTKYVDFYFSATVSVTQPYKPKWVTYDTGKDISVYTMDVINTTGSFKFSVSFPIQKRNYSPRF